MSRFIYGTHAITEFLRETDAAGTLLLSLPLGKVKPERLGLLENLALERGVRVSWSNVRELDRISGGRKHGGALLLLEKEPFTVKKAGFSDYLKKMEGSRNILLLLDGVMDPHNLGAILRSCDQFCVDAVIIPSRKSAGSTETVSKVSSGAAVHVPLWVVPNLVRIINQIKETGFWVFGADMKGDRADGADLSGRTALVLGSEGRGLHRLVQENCDGLVWIPAAGHVDSFNVSVAAGILLYEIRRQQSFPHINHD